MFNDLKAPLQTLNHCNSHENNQAKKLVDLFGVKVYESKNRQRNLNDIDIHALGIQMTYFSSAKICILCCRPVQRTCRPKLTDWHK